MKYIKTFESFIDEGIWNENLSIKEGNAFVYAAARARQQGKKEFTFGGRKYRVTIGDTGLK